MIRFSMAALVSLFLFSCTSTTVDQPVTLKTGLWRGTLDIQNHELPFNFEVKRDSSGAHNLWLINAGERILLDEVAIEQDSITIGLHIFDAALKGKIKGEILEGVFVKNYATDYRIPFRAEYGKSYRFKKEQDNTITKDFSGTYSVTFVSEEDTTQAIGVFNQYADSVTGTFLTATGDYRYLEGDVVNDEMHLSAFDGNNAYLFHAKFTADETLTGKFYSGKTHEAEWQAVRNDTASLPDASSLTFLKEGYEKIDFTFPDVNGNHISLEDAKFKNKVVILQLFGTWCPNCMDETRFLAPWYEKNKHRGIEIIGLAYERKDDFAYASGRVKKMIAKLDVGYDFVIAGTNEKGKAAQSLPMLNTIMAFPTTIFIGKDGKVKKIHTGFSGPGTGKYYEQFKTEFNETINSLLQESV